MYNYNEALKEDINEWIKDNAEWIPADVRYDRNEFEEWLNDTLWTADSVTGNGSGSYTFNTYTAEEYICHNLDILAEACEAFGGNMDVLKDGAEACDVTIRCYLLGGIISEVLDELEDNGYFEEV